MKYKKVKAQPNCSLCKWSKERVGYLIGGYDCTAQCKLATFVYGKRKCKKLYEVKDEI